MQSVSPKVLFSNPYLKQLIFIQISCKMAQNKDKGWAPWLLKLRFTVVEQRWKVLKIWHHIWFTKTYLWNAIIQFLNSSHKMPMPYLLKCYQLPYLLFCCVWVNIFLTWNGLDWHCHYTSLKVKFMSSTFWHSLASHIVQIASKCVQMCKMVLGSGFDCNYLWWTKFLSTFHFILYSRCKPKTKMN